MKRFNLMQGFYIQHGGDHVSVFPNTDDDGGLPVRHRQFSALIGKRVRIVAEVIE